MSHTPPLPRRTVTVSDEISAARPARRQHEFLEIAPQLGELPPSSLASGQERREVIDRAAAPATEAIPAPARLPIYVQTGRSVIVEQAVQLARRSYPQPS